ncbi:signal peptidase I [Haloplanus natans]|uniref:signal peptidase I n=1 Tax=Haloplanus natans TaxID=376171 RepID=UPI0006780E39|nr:signal peptidase I [Haloplanus natans]
MKYDMRQIVRPPTVGRALLVVVLLALIAPFVVYAVPATVGAEASYVVLTASMTPAIAPGDVVIVDSVPARSVAVGDVIVFEQRSGDAIPITHRVIDVERPADAPPSFRTKGDANEDADLTPVTPDRLVGRVVFTIPLIGHVVQFVGTPAGFVTLVVLPLGLLVASEVTSLLRAGRPDEVTAAPTADANDPAAPSASAAAEADDAATDPAPDDQVVVTPADLTLTSIALGAFTVYAGYAAFQTTTTLSVTLAVAGAALFALAVGIRLFASADESAADRLASAPTVHVDAGRSPGPTVEVPSPGDLSGIAATLGRPVLRDDRDRYVVLDGSVTYACEAPAESDATTDADEHTDAALAPESLTPTATEPSGASR